MNGHRKESTGNQKGWMACAINSERTNILLPVGAGCPLCHLYIIFLTLLGGGGDFTTHTGKQQEMERLHGDIKGKPKGTTRNTNSNHQEIKWFQQEITRHQQEIHSHEWTQKGIHRKSKGGWLAPSILNAHPSYSPRERKKPCAIYFFVAPFPKITTHQKPCAIYPP